MDVPMHAPPAAQATLACIEQANRAFAVDCEFIEVRQGKGGAERTFRVTVSIGVVSEQLETILYARVKQPQRTQVFDDSFARCAGKLEPDWALGVRLEVAQSLVRGLLDGGRSVLVGWQASEIAQRHPVASLKCCAPQVAGDLAGLRLEELQRDPRVLDLSEHIQTASGAKCRLAEAYRAVFSRDLAAHDACDDAKMTMELFNHWRRAGMAPIRLELH
jgi:hypothetical protein